MLAQSSINSKVHLMEIARSNEFKFIIITLLQLKNDLTKKVKITSLSILDLTFFFNFVKLQVKN